MTGQRFLKVPLEPPSVNHYKLPNRGGGWRLSAGAQAFKDAVVIFARQLPAMACEFYAIEIRYVLAERTRIDIDNAAKLVLDGLEASGMIRNDSCVLDLVQHKRRTRDARQVGTWITVSEFRQEQWV